MLSATGPFPSRVTLDSCVWSGSRVDLAIAPEFHQIDAEGQYLIPGLTNAHVHLEHFTSPEVLKLFVANGVTTVRNMDGRPYILRWREGVRNGSFVEWVVSWHRPRQPIPRREVAP